DPELAQTLAASLMEAEAKRLGEELGVAWVRPVATTSLYGITSDLHRVTLPAAPLTDEEQTRCDKIEERVQVIESDMEDEGIDDDTYAALDAESDRLREEYQAIHDKAPELTDEVKGQVGVFLTLGRDGKMTL
ncbi:chromosome partitioning protein ParB, partial [Herbaspirillum sp. HC18]